MSLTLKSKLVLAFFVAIIFSIMSVLIVVFMEVNTYSKDSFKRAACCELHLVDVFISEVIGTGKNILTSVASFEDTHQALGHLSTFYGPNGLTGTDLDRMHPSELKLYHIFESIVEKNPAYEAMLVGSEQGGFLVYPPDPSLKGFDPRKRGWYKHTQSSSKDVELSNAFTCNKGFSIICATTRMQNVHGDIAGVLGLNIKLATLTDLTSRLKLGRTGYIVILDVDGTILSAPNDPKLNFKKAQETNLAAFNKMATMTKGCFASEINGQEKLITVITSKATGWKLAYIMDQEEIFERSNSMLAKSLLIGCGIAALFLVGAWFLAVRLVRPLTILTFSAEALAGGDLNALPDARHFTGEFLSLYTSFKKMVGELVASLDSARNKARDAEEKSQQAERAVHEAEEAQHQAEQAQNGMLQAAKALEEIVEQVTSASQELSAQIEEASRGAAAQRDRTTETATAMEQMNASVMEVASNASHAAESADKARKEAEGGGAIVEQVVTSIKEVNTNARAMSATLDTLGSQAQDIGQIMTVITDIADQTNLLALNAAIEAARAGEAGRGFAVVADEVRKLAEKTMTATKEVGDAVASIQKGADGAITSMGEGAKLVSQSTELAGQAGDALQDILGIVDNTADQVRAIAAASEEQSATSEEIARNTDGVTQIASQTSEAMEHASQALADLTQLTKDMIHLIQQLKQHE
ncbi:MAG: chemotaxis protein [Deltaproteobacteria bacterium]|nr:MAG: chemotaxis protein [Deltaproteobacteria bacterium]